MRSIKWRDQSGSALLLVIFMIVVFTMLGLALMGAAIGGAQRSETREKDVQSLHLAEMALNEAAASVAVLFKDKEDINLETLKSQLEAIKLSSISGQVGGTGEVVKFIVNENTGVNVGGDLTKRFSISVQAKAQVDGVVRTLEQEIKLDSYPEFLKYGLGSENNVFLNGASYLFGDLYSGIKLYVRNQADYRYNMPTGDKSFLHADTIFPTISDGDLYLQDGSSIMATDRLGSNTPTIVPLDNESELTKTTGLTANDIIYRDRKKFVAVNLEESFLDKIAEAVGDTKLNRNTPSYYPMLPEEGFVQAAKGVISDLVSNPRGLSFKVLPSVRPVLAPDADDKARAEYNDQMAAYRAAFVGTMPSSTVIYDGDLTLDGAEFKQILFSKVDKSSRVPNPVIGANYMQSNWLIVNGNLTINNVLKNSDLPVRANILVAGDVLIQGNVKMDATIMALGKSTIQDAEISGLDGSELLLMSKGKILVNRFDSFNTVSTKFKPDAPDADGNPKVLQAFLYTDSEAELYGVGSAFWIKGGFFAKKDLVINAVLGNTRPVIFPDDPDRSYQSLDLDDMNTSAFVEDKRLLSRFIVQYNANIYNDQMVGLPRVRQINVSIGKKRLVPLGSETQQP
ncbi:hypothetical protein [Cohnella sp. 56]|uniref:hypothetical protein n=1 Tax=Cohnella sp. 56 TaxID=3113722 RepID=UPI0030E904DE